MEIQDSYLELNYAWVVVLKSKTRCFLQTSQSLVHFQICRRVREMVHSYHRRLTNLPILLNYIVSSKKDLRPLFIILAHGLDVILVMIHARCGLQGPILMRGPIIQ